MKETRDYKLLSEIYTQLNESTRPEDLNGTRWRNIMGDLWVVTDDHDMARKANARGQIVWYKMLDQGRMVTHIQREYQITNTNEFFGHMRRMNAEESNR